MNTALPPAASSVAGVAANGSVPQANQLPQFSVTPSGVLFFTLSCSLSPQAHCFHTMHTMHSQTNHKTHHTQMHTLSVCGTPSWRRGHQAAAHPHQHHIPMHTGSYRQLQCSLLECTLPRGFVHQAWGGEREQHRHQQLLQEGVCDCGVLCVASLCQVLLCNNFDSVQLQRGLSL